MSRRDTREVLLIDRDSGKIEHRYPTRHIPRSIVFSPNGKSAYVSAYDDGSALGFIAILDLVTKRKVDLVPVGTQPYNSAITSDGKWLYVPNHGAHYISVLSTSGERELRKIEVRTSPHSVILTKDGKHAYAAIHEGDAVASFDMDGEKWGSISYIPVGAGMSPHALALTPNEQFIYVADYDGGKLSVIRVGPGSDRGTVSDTIDLNLKMGPQAIAMAPDGKHAYVGVDSDPKSQRYALVTIDTETNSVVKKIALKSSPTSISISPDGRTAYVTQLTDGTVIPYQIA